MATAIAALSSCSGKLIRLGDGPSSAAGTADGGSAGDACARGLVAADEVLWIGDSWANNDATQQDTVKDLALAAGAISADERYPSSAVAAASMAMVAQQYGARERGTPKVKVLLMDGGTWDPIAAQMAGSSVPDAIDESIATFQQFLLTVARDGTVEHIVYFLVPELANITGVAEMRPRLKQACAASAVPCHFIDLQDVWQKGDPVALTAGNGFQASPEGGVAIGEAVWATMQDNCIAQ